MRFDPPERMALIFRRRLQRIRTGNPDGLNEGRESPEPLLGVYGGGYFEPVGRAPALRHKLKHISFALIPRMGEWQMACMRPIA
jgi:hypothetical protein